jgi:hypothetical protein
MMNQGTMDTPAFPASGVYYPTTLQDGVAERSVKASTFLRAIQKFLETKPILILVYR